MGLMPYETIVTPDRPTYAICSGATLVSFRLATCIAAIILTFGDVESNPGPPKETGTRLETQHSNQDAARDSLDGSESNRPLTRAQAPSGATPANGAQSQNTQNTKNIHHTAVDPKQRRISTNATPLVSHPNSHELSQ
ncbi:hypothetical protein DPMN_111667 [Dreissena polymorpha]|uniref:Uncharacterized protein n=1 Tax=Dreissena polymorpha TaxID=45954 RepID=A0A9D4QP81_DREPO|nr:hypothetical protein DPMN_111667 [Dreissena polymorpha]